MQQSEYYQRIIDYYTGTEHAYKDSWDLDNSLAIHYGYRDAQVKSFPQSLQRMNEVMAEAVSVRVADRVLDAGCGIGGSSFFLAEKKGCTVTGISLSERQIQQARELAKKKRLDDKVCFETMDYCHTNFPDQNFDVIWGCESFCYAADKAQLMQEAFRLLKPGGRMILADGFVSDFENNNHPFIRHWLDGWQVNYLETPLRLQQLMRMAGFENITHRDISVFIESSSRRLYRIYFLASLYLLWKKISFSKPPSDIQKKNIIACYYQYKALKAGLWQYGLIAGYKK